MTSVALIAIIVMLVLFSQVIDLRRQAEIRALMNGVLTHRGQATVDEIALAVREHKHYLRRHVADAHALRRAGHDAEAIASLQFGCDAVEDLAPHFLASLRKLRRLARCVSAIVDIEPVSARAFRSMQLQGLAGMGALLHYALLTGSQRVRLRVRVVAAAFRLALRALRTSVDQLVRRNRERYWRRVDNLVADLGTSGDEALVATRQIAEALDAVEFGTALAHRTHT
jgi:hypothetical protein